MSGSCQTGIRFQTDGFVDGGVSSSIVVMKASLDPTSASAEVLSCARALFKQAAQGGSHVDEHALFEMMQRHSHGCSRELCASAVVMFGGGRPQLGDFALALHGWQGSFQVCVPLQVLLRSYGSSYAHHGTQHSLLRSALLL